MLCCEEFLIRIEKIARAAPLGIVLREKDLPEEDYKKLARAVMEICNKYDTPCILHNFVKVAEELDCHAVHLPLSILRTLSTEDKKFFTTLGASCHSAKDAMEAEKLGCSYITAGHVFDTDCKKGLPGRGLVFLKAVVNSVSVPVYAIGGIRPENGNEIRMAGAKGACVMSSMMTCDNPAEFLAAFREDYDTME